MSKARDVARHSGASSCEAYLLGRMAHRRAGCREVTHRVASWTVPLCRTEIEWAGTIDHPSSLSPSDASATATASASASAVQDALAAAGSDAQPASEAAAHNFGTPHLSSPLLSRETRAASVDDLVTAFSAHFEATHAATLASNDSDGDSSAPSSSPAPGTPAATLGRGVSTAQAIKDVREFLDLAELRNLAAMRGAAAAALAQEEALQPSIKASRYCPDDLVGDEVNFATGMSAAWVSALTSFATDRRAAGLRSRAANGEASVRLGFAVWQKTQSLPEPVEWDALWDSIFADQRGGEAPSERLILDRAHREVARRDTTRAARKANAERRVGCWLRDDGDGLGTLHVVNDLAKLAALLDRVETAARAARAAGDERSLPRLRADFITGAVNNAWPVHQPAASGQPNPAPGGPADTSDGDAAEAQAGGPLAAETHRAGEGAWPSAAQGPSTTPTTQPPTACRAPGGPDRPTAKSADSGAAAGSSSSSPESAGGAEAHEADPMTRSAAEPSATASASEDAGMQQDSSPADADHDAARATSDERCQAADQDAEELAERCVPGPGPCPDCGAGGAFTSLRPHPPARVWVVVPMSTAVGSDDALCEVPGHGWVSADTARELMAAEDSTWSLMFADATSGRALGISRSYRPTPRMRRLVEAVDGVCRAPGCEIQARWSDQDHDFPYAPDGSDPRGDTRVENLTSKHRRHHRAKTSGTHHVERDPDSGTVKWTTPSGRTYTTQPKDWLDEANQARDGVPPGPEDSHGPDREAPNEAGPPPAPRPPDDDPPF